MCLKPQAANSLGNTQHALCPGIQGHPRVKIWENILSYFWGSWRLGKNWLLHKRPLHTASRLSKREWISLFKPIQRTFLELVGSTSFPAELWEECWPERSIPFVFSSSLSLSPQAVSCTDKLFYSYACLVTYNMLEACFCCLFWV